MVSDYSKNVLSNIASQGFVALVGIVSVPLLVTSMGAEAFGLIGFFQLLQAWFNLLDMGMTPTLSREAARYCGGAISGSDLRQLLRTMEGLFTGVGVLGALGMALGSGAIATSWLHVETLSRHDVRLSIILMGLVIALRWIGEVCRGGIGGFERMIWLGWFRSIIAVLRFVLVIPLLHVTGGKPVVYFAYQTAVAVLELAVLRWKLYRLLPEETGAHPTLWNWTVLKPVLGFSASIAFTSSIWVLVTQLDKLVLSKYLPLSEFGYFTLAVVVASGIPLLSGPISTALLPRLTRLVASGDEPGMIQLYRDATQMVAVLVLPAAVLLSCFAPEVLFVWTGNPLIAHKAAAILRLYAIGNGILAILAFQYYLQFAKGNLRLHVLGNLILVVILVPSVVLATIRYGSLGAGTVWAAVNVLYMIAWAPIVHRRFLPGLHATWLRIDIGTIFLPVGTLGAVLGFLLPHPGGRILAGLEVMGVGIVLTVLAVLGSSWGRAQVRAVWARTRGQRQHHGI